MTAAEKFNIHPDWKGAVYDPSWAFMTPEQKFNHDREAELRRLLNQEETHRRVVSGRLIIPPPEVGGWPWNYWTPWAERMPSPWDYVPDFENRRRPNPQWVDANPHVDHWQHLTAKDFAPVADDKDVMNENLKQAAPRPEYHLEKIRAIVRQRVAENAKCAEAIKPLREAWAAIRDECPHARTVSNQATTLAIRWGGCNPVWTWKAQYCPWDGEVKFSAEGNGGVERFATALAMLEAFYEHCATFGALSPYSSSQQIP